VSTTYDQITSSKQDSAPTTLFIFSGAEDSQYVAERLIRSVCLIPGATEFGYGTTTVRKTDGSIHENSYAGGEITDLVRSMEQLIERAPNLGHVSLVVAWHGTDLRIGNCEIKPKVDRAVKGTIPYSWQVGPTTRANAEEVSYTGGFPAAGGAPSDRSVYEAITWLKARGLEVTLYPFIFMDVENGNSLPNPYGGTGQPAYPWRGRITCYPAPGQPWTVDQTAAAEVQVSNFFGTVNSTHFGWDGVNQVVTYTGPATEWSFRRHILHLATIADAAGADDFLIGTEMVEMNRIRSARGVFPAVNELISLLGQVRNIVGSSMKVSYAADWSEWNGYRPPDGTGDVWFHLDPLWSDSRITYIGIDNYMKTSDWRDGSDHLDALENWPSIYDLNYQRGNIRGGEDYDWFYASQADRDNQTRTPISDGAYNKPWVYRQKDLWNWWSNEHINRLGGVEGSLTGQTTELGEAEGYAEATVEVVPEILVVGPVTISLKLRNISDGGSLTLETATKGDTDILGDVVQLNATEWEYDLTDAIPTDTLVFEFNVTAPGLDDNTLTITIKPFATGGTIHDVDRDGETWRVHVFDALPQDAGHQDGEDNDNPIPTIQNFRVNEPISEMRVLVVGGGARGNTGNGRYSSSGGGGSAGEFFETFLNNVSEGIYEVQVGKGGGWSGSPAATYWSASPSRFEFINAARGVEGSSYEDEDDFFDVTFVGGAGGDYPGPEGWEGGDSVFQQLWPVFGRPGAGGGAGAGGNGGQGGYGSGIFLTGSYITHGAGGAGGAGVTSDITGFNEVYCEGGAGAGPVTGIFRERGFDSYPTPKPLTKGSGGVGGWSIHNGLSESYGGRELTRPGHGSDGVVVVSYRLPSPVSPSTPWVPESKPIVFTEIGCPAVSRGPNQPNVFVDPKSSESSLPYYSLGVRDDMAQRSFLEASLSFWENDANNPQSSVYSGRMLDKSRTSIWSWDARPFPDFPGADDFWGDAPNWELGHWINGRIEQPQALAGTMDTFRYTDSDKPITFGGDVYDPLPVKPGKVKQDGGLERVSFQITVPRNAGIAALLREFRPAHSMMLTVLQGQATDGTGLFVPRWHGRISSTKRKGEQLEIVGIPSAAALSRAGLTRNYQIGCPHVLYGPMCKADRDAATRTGTISSITGDQITLNSGWEGSFAKNKYVTGMVEWTRSNSRIERRRILAVAGKTLTLSGPPTELAPTDTVSVILGCNQTVFDCVDLHNNIHNCGACPTIPNKNPLASEANNFY
jgi:hypothetical protein